MSSQHKPNSALTDGCSNEFPEPLDVKVFETLVEHMSNGVAYCRMCYLNGLADDYQYIYTNPAFEQLTGLRQVCGKKLSQIVPKICSKESELFGIYAAVAAGAEPQRFEIYVEPLAEWFWVSVYSPNPGYFVTLFNVITQRKQTELALQEANIRFSLAQRAADAGFWYWDLKRNSLFWSDELYNLFGLNPRTAQASFETWVELLVEEDRAPSLEGLNRCFSENLPLFNEYRIITPAGQLRWIRALGDRVVDLDGNLHGVTGICMDITESKYAEIALQESEERLRLAQLAGGIGIWDWDLLTRKVQFNTEYYRILGLAEGEVHSYRAFISRLHRGDRRRLNLLVRQLLKQDMQEYTIEFRLSGHTDGSLRWLASKGRVWRKNGRATRGLGVIIDITERKTSEQRIEFLANFDSLTNLPNRHQLLERFETALESAIRNQTQLALIFLDLDNFKNVNDNLGHSIGDLLLVELAKRLTALLSDADTISRLGGDEFILLLPDTSAAAAANLAQQLLDIISQPYQIENYDLTLTASIGIALYPEHGASLEILSKNADIAMYRAKREGRQTFRFFTPEMELFSARNLQLLNALHRAVEFGQLSVYYQPQIAIDSGAIIGAEALLRWHHPELGAISPAEFIPIAEDSGLILTLGEWVLRTTLRQVKGWFDQGLEPFVIAVNISAVQFCNNNLLEVVSNILAEEQFPPEYLELELTEGAAMHHPPSAIQLMNKLHQLGIRMSIDDFGTGYSSLSYLKKFKVYKLKIDKSFVNDLHTDPEDKAIVNGVISLAKSLSLKTIAEGVETPEQLRYLQVQGCDEMQGYLFSRPLPADKFAQLLKERGVIARFKYCG